MKGFRRREFNKFFALAMIGSGTGCMANVETSLRPVARSAAVSGAGAELRLSRELIGQLILVGFAGQRPGDAGVEAVAEQMRNGTIGGVLLLGRNVRSPEQLKNLTDYLANQGGETPFIAVDQEGGRVQRLRAEQGFQPWTAARNLRSLPDGDPLRYYMSRARALADLGINFNFAPVVDVDKNRENPIIGALGRSYSSDPETVSSIATAFVSAHRSAGILTSLKHFPGHGSATQDSHLVLPEVSANWSRDELQPFRALVGARLADTIMMAHLYHPEFSDAPGIPSSLSRKAHALLRNDLGFDGVVVTDDLQMKAIQRRYSEEDAATAALRAGSDLLVYSTFERPDPTVGPRINQALSNAIVSGEITKERLVQSYLRITALKQRI